jgi:hypothetical protein
MILLLCISQTYSDSENILKLSQTHLYSHTTSCWLIKSLNRLMSVLHKNMSCVRRIHLMVCQMLSKRNVPQEEEWSVVSNCAVLSKKEKKWRCTLLAAFPLIVKVIRLQSLSFGLSHTYYIYQWAKVSEQFGKSGDISDVPKASALKLKRGPPMCWYLNNHQFLDLQIS